MRGRAWLRRSSRHVVCMKLLIPGSARSPASHALHQDVWISPCSRPLCEKARAHGMIGFSLRTLALKRSSRLEPERLAALQRRRLRALVRRAIDGSPFYREKYRGIDPERFALADLPPTNKNELMSRLRRRRDRAGRASGGARAVPRRPLQRGAALPREVRGQPYVGEPGAADADRAGAEGDRAPVLAPDVAGQCPQGLRVRGDPPPPPPGAAGGGDAEGGLLPLGLDLRLHARRRTPLPEGLAALADRPRRGRAAQRVPAHDPDGVCRRARDAGARGRGGPIAAGPRAEPGGQQQRGPDRPGPHPGRARRSGRRS